MPMEQFSQHLLPSLLSLSSDPVANVRVLVAKALRQSVMEKGKIQTKGCRKHKVTKENPNKESCCTAFVRRKLLFPISNATL